MERNQSDLLDIAKQDLTLYFSNVNVTRFTGNDQGRRGFIPEALASNMTWRTVQSRMTRLPRCVNFVVTALGNTARQLASGASLLVLRALLRGRMPADFSPSSGLLPSITGSIEFLTYRGFRG